MALKFQCKCGEIYDTPQQLREHIALLNPRWPRTSLADDHRIRTTADLAEYIAKEASRD